MPGARGVWPIGLGVGMLMCTMALSGPRPHAGGRLDRGGSDVPGPSLMPGQLLVRLANDRRSESCLPVRAALDTDQEPIAMPLDDFEVADGLDADGDIELSPGL